MVLPKVSHKPLHIGFLTERLRLGFGVDLVIHQVAEGLSAKGHRVTVFCSVVEGLYNNPRHYQIVKYKTCQKKYGPRYEAEVLLKHKQLVPHDVDIFIAVSYPFFGLSALIKKPFIAYEHGMVPIKDMPLKHKLYLTYIQLIQFNVYHRFPKKIVAISEFVKTSLPKSIQKKTEVIYNGIDHYRPASKKEIIRFKKKHGLWQTQPLLLTVSRLNTRIVPYKGLSLLLEIFKNIRSVFPKTQLIVAGQGSSEDERRIKRHANVTVLRNVPACDMPALYGTPDIYVSASQWEGFNLPLLEAQMAGKATLVFDKGAHREVLRGSGVIADNASDFEKELLKLMTDTRHRSRIACRSQKNAAFFTWQKTVDSFDRCIRQTIQQNTYASL